MATLKGIGCCWIIGMGSLFSYSPTPACQPGLHVCLPGWLSEARDLSDDWWPLTLVSMFAIIGKRCCCIVALFFEIARTSAARRSSLKHSFQSRAPLAHPVVCHNSYFKNIRRKEKAARYTTLFGFPSHTPVVESSAQTLHRNIFSGIVVQWFVSALERDRKEKFGSVPI